MYSIPNLNLREKKTTVAVIFKLSEIVDITGTTHFRCF